MRRNFSQGGGGGSTVDEKSIARFSKKKTDYCTVPVLIVSFDSDEIKTSGFVFKC